MVEISAAGPYHYGQTVRGWGRLEDLAMGEIKSSYEAAMERLKERGIETKEKALSAEQKEEIGEIRREFEAKLAELDIMAQSSRRKAQSREELEELEKRLGQERAALKEEMERRIEAVRRQGKV